MVFDSVPKLPFRELERFLPRLLWQHLDNDRRWSNPDRVVIFAKRGMTCRTNVSACALSRTFQSGNYSATTINRNGGRSAPLSGNPMALPLAGNFRKSPRFRNILACRAAPYRATIMRLVILKPADF